MDTQVNEKGGVSETEVCIVGCGEEWMMGQRGDQDCEKSKSDESNYPKRGLSQCHKGLREQATQSSGELDMSSFMREQG